VVSRVLVPERSRRRGDGLCDECRSRSHADRAPIHARYGHGAYPYVCRCGQHAVALEAGAPRVCDACRDLARAPQGEAVRLFTPAPAQLPGQEWLRDHEGEYRRELPYL
jgi:hypothetical protein